MTKQVEVAPGLIIEIIIFRPVNLFEQTPFEDSFVDIEYEIENISDTKQIENHSVNTLLLS